MRRHRLISRKALKIGAVLLLTIAMEAATQETQHIDASRAYPNELPQFRYYSTAIWRQLIPTHSTMADVRRTLGTPNDADDIASYTMPYPGDKIAKEPVFTYSHLIPGWDVLIYFSRYCFRKHPADPVGDRICSVDLIPNHRIPMSEIKIPEMFKREHVVAADAAFDEYTDDSGLQYSVYTTKTPYSDKTYGDLNRISYGFPLIAKPETP